MKAVSITTLFVVLIYFPLTFCGSSSTPSPLSFTSYLYILPPPPTPYPLLHAMLLFLGPLTYILLSASQLLKRANSTRGWRLRQALHHVLVEEHGMPETLFFWEWRSESVRNLIIAPLTEELIYRWEIHLCKNEGHSRERCVSRSDISMPELWELHVLVTWGTRAYRWASLCHVRVAELLVVVFAPY